MLGAEIEFPSLWDEKSLGYDAKIVRRKGKPFFFQFKRSIRRTRRRGLDAQQGNVPPYLQFQVHSTEQHNAMVKLRNKYGSAYYVAPRIILASELYAAAIRRRLYDESLRFAPQVPIKDKNHRFVFYESGNTFKFFSESRTLGFVSDESQFVASMDRIAEVPVESILTDLSELFSSLRSRRRLGEQIGRRPRMEGPQPTLKGIARFLRSYNIVFGLAVDKSS